jgi:hypothetical protein
MGRPTLGLQLMGIRLFPKDIARIKKLLRDEPEMNISSWIRAAIREKLDRDEKKKS